MAWPVQPGSRSPLDYRQSKTVTKHLGLQWTGRVKLPNRKRKEKKGEEAQGQGSHKERGRNRASKTFFPPLFLRSTDDAGCCFGTTWCTLMGLETVAAWPGSNFDLQNQESKKRKSKKHLLRKYPQPK